jgi:hypothetical protein
MVYCDISTLVQIDRSGSGDAGHEEGGDSGSVAHVVILLVFICLKEARPDCYGEMNS